MSDLGERLRRLPIPPADEARARAATSAAERVARMGGRPSRSAPRLMRFGVAALALLAALVGFAFTPPGKTVSGELGDLVGIGEPATLPPELSPGLVGPRRPGVVIASGRAPDGAPYEVVASRGVATEPRSTAAGTGAGSVTERGGGRVMTCLTVDLPESPERGTVEFCVGSQHARGVVGVNVADRAFPDKEPEFAGSKARYVLTAVLNPSVARVEVTYQDGAGEGHVAFSDVGTVTRAIAKKIRTDDRVAYLVAFLPDDGLPSDRRTGRGPSDRRDAGILGTVTVVGFDSSGAVVGGDDFGQRITNHYDRQNEDLSRQQGFRDDIEAAQRRDGLAFNRANVDLCSDALLARVKVQACLDLIEEAADKRLFGWRSND
jgi:hypothetical protein